MSFEQQFKLWIEKNEENINWEGISENPNITCDIIENNPDNNWKWNALSANPNITWDIVIKNPDKDWNWYWLSKNPNITWDIVIKNPDKPWNWWGLSKNPNITMDIVENNPDKPWDWWGMSQNPNITMDIIENNPDKDWDWRAISANPNITWDIIENNPDKHWNWDMISKNPFTRQREIIEKENAVRLIQNKWRDAIADPTLRLGRKKIFENMQDGLGEEVVEYTGEIDREIQGYTKKEIKTTSVCIKVSNLRKIGYSSLKNWMENKNNIYVGRRGRVFIKNEETNEMDYFSYKGSKWQNPTKIKKGNDIKENLREYVKYLFRSGLVNEIDELRGKNLGCFCEHHRDKNGVPLCHAQVLAELLNKCL